MDLQLSGGLETNIHQGGGLLDSQPASHRVQASIPTKPTMLHYWGTIALPRGLNSVSEGMRIWAASLWSHRGQSSPPAGLSFVYSPGTEQLIPSSATCGESPQSCRICSALPSRLWQGSTPGSMFANNGRACAYSHAHAYYP